VVYLLSVVTRNGWMFRKYFEKIYSVLQVKSMTKNDYSCNTKDTVLQRKQFHFGRQVSCSILIVYSPNNQIILS